MWERFTHAYQGAPPSIRTLIDSPLIPALARSLCEERISKSEVRETIIVLSDFALGLIEKDELQDVLGCSASQTETVVNELHSLRSPEGDGPLPKADRTVKEELELRPRGVPQQPLTQTPEAEASQPLTREDVLNALASRRTMASDIESVKKSQENKDE